MKNYFVIFNVSCLKYEIFFKIKKYTLSVRSNNIFWLYIRYFLFYLIFFCIFFKKIRQLKIEKNKKIKGKK